MAYLRTPIWTTNMPRVRRETSQLRWSSQWITSISMPSTTDPIRDLLTEASGSQHLKKEKKSLSTSWLRDHTEACQTSSSSERSTPTDFEHRKGCILDLSFAIILPLSLTCPSRMWRMQSTQWKNPGHLVQNHGFLGDAVWAVVFSEFNNCRKSEDPKFVQNCLSDRKRTKFAGISNEVKRKSFSNPQHWVQRNPIRCSRELSHSVLLTNTRFWLLKDPLRLTLTAFWNGGDDMSRVVLDLASDLRCPQTIEFKKCNRWVVLSVPGIMFFFPWSF